VALFIGGLAAFVAWGFSSAFGGGAMAGGGWTVQAQHSYAINNSLMQYSWQNTNRAGPEHGLELVLFGNLGAWQWGGPSFSPFCQPGTKTTPTDIPVGDATLEDFLALSTSEKLGAAKDLLETLPDGIVAHRVGDFVFTHHGLTLSGSDPSLWTVIMVPDPDVNGTPLPTDVVHISTDGYMVDEILYRELAEALKEQNAYRKTLGLDPLPDPVTITHAKPALSSAGSGAPNSEEKQ
jgi:hypothetical protein